MSLCDQHGMALAQIASGRADQKSKVNRRAMCRNQPLSIHGVPRNNFGVDVFKWSQNIFYYNDGNLKYMLRRGIWPESSRFQLPVQIFFSLEIVYEFSVYLVKGSPTG